MKFSLTKIIVSLSVIFTFVLFALSFNMFPTGYVGTTKKGGVAFGCICHGSSPTTSVSVFFAGPDSVAAGQTVTFTVKLSHGPAIKGGFNVASGDTSSLKVLTGDGTVRKQDGELTHTMPKSFVNDTVSWSFGYTAPGTPQIDTLFATGNSCNNDTSSDGDQWNWSENRQVRVYNPIGIINISSLAGDFSISQNYPNPFNPSTQIKFTVAKSSHIEIKIYDILGNTTAVIVNENLKTGEYRSDFNAAGLASGIYFYSLFANGEKISTRKMIVVK